MEITFNREESGSFYIGIQGGVYDTKEIKVLRNGHRIILFLCSLTRLNMLMDKSDDVLDTHYEIVEHMGDRWTTIQKSKKRRT